MQARTVEQRPERRCSRPIGQGARRRTSSTRRPASASLSRARSPTTSHLSKLERIAKEHRDADRSRARRRRDLRSRRRGASARPSERVRMDAVGEMTQHPGRPARAAHERDARRADGRASRRDLEGLKKLDLLQEQRYRELRDFEWRLRQDNDDLPEIFEAGMGAEAVQCAALGHRPGRARGQAAPRDLNAPAASAARRPRSA